MLAFIALFLIIALIAGFLGFTGVYAAATGIAQILFYIFIALFLISLIVYLLRGKRPPMP
jgi:uncharacterized membrane protein YtjA (UPF0391 family)